MSTDFTPKSFIARSNKEYQFTFFCDLCNMSFTSSLINVGNQKEALEIAKKEIRMYFNYCQKCNSWVCDEHFNENKMMCTDCAPRICSNCGLKVEKKDQFCTKCGTPQYEIKREMNTAEDILYG